MFKFFAFQSHKRITQNCVLFIYLLTTCRWVDVLRWRENVPSGKPVAEGIPGGHLHLYLLWRTAGTFDACCWKVWGVLRSFVFIAVLLLFLWRAGDARTAGGREERQMWRLNCCIRLRQTLTTATEKTLWRSWSVSNLMFSNYTHI